MCWQQHLSIAGAHHQLNCDIEMAWLGWGDEFVLSSHVFFKEKWHWSRCTIEMILQTERTNENHTLFCDGRGSHFLFLANKWKTKCRVRAFLGVVYALLTLIKETCLFHWFLLFSKSIHFMLMTFTPIQIFENNFHFRSIQFHSFY